MLQTDGESVTGSPQLHVESIDQDVADDEHRHERGGREAHGQDEREQRDKPAAQSSGSVEWSPADHRSGSSLLSTAGLRM